MTALLSCILAVAVVWFACWCIGALWRLVEALVQGGVGGLRLFWRLARWTALTLWRGLRAVQYWMVAADLWLAQRTHAAWWVYSYWLKRAYIAASLRAARRTR